MYWDYSIGRYNIRSVYVNGVEQPRVRVIDTDKGRVVKLKLQDGEPYLLPGTEDIAEEEVHGDVTVVFTDRPPLVCRRPSLREPIDSDCTRYGEQR